MTTPEDIFSEYDAMFDAAWRTQQGPDVPAIIEALARAHKMDPAEVREIVLDHTIQRAC